MSDTSQTAARIAVLAAATFLFAAAWRGDESASSRPALVLATSKRASGRAATDGRDGYLAFGLQRANPGQPRQHRLGSQLCRAVETTAERAPTPRTLFSGTPALLGRSTIAESTAVAEPQTAATIATDSAIQ